MKIKSLPKCMIIFIVLLLVGQEYINYLLLVFIFPRDMYIHLLDTECTNQYFIQQSTVALETNMHRSHSQCAIILGGIMRSRLNLASSSSLYLFPDSFSYYIAAHIPKIWEPLEGLFLVYIPNSALTFPFPFQGALPIPGLFPPPPH